MTGWRRVASAMWRSPDDPQIFGAFEVDARPLIAFMEKHRAAGQRVTPTHLVGRALAHMLAAVPDLNVRIVNGRVYPRPTVDVFFIASVGSGHDLSGVKIVDVPGKPATAIASELLERATAMKGGRDKDFARSKRLTDRIPAWLLRPTLRATAFLTEQLQLDLPKLGLYRSPFGSAMVSSVGMFGLPHGFAPLAWMYDVPLLVLVGEITERPVVEAGAVVARPILPLTATIDHRYADGWHVSRALAAFREYLADPSAFEPALTDSKPESRPAEARALGRA